MTSTGSDSSSYAWFNIDICTPPLEDEDEDETVRNNKHATENVQHSVEHSEAADYTKKHSTPTASSEPTHEPTIPKTKNESKVPLSPFEYVTKRPPVRLARPTATEKKSSETAPPVNEHSAASSTTHARCEDGPFSSSSVRNNVAPPSEAQESSTDDSVISSVAQYIDKGVYSSYQGLFLLIALLLTLLAAPLFTLLNKIRESRRAHSFNYTEYEEQY